MVNTTDAENDKLSASKPIKKQPKKHKLLVYSVDVAYNKANRTDDDVSSRIPISSPTTRRVVVNRETLNTCGWNKFHQRYLTVPPGTNIYP